MYHVNYNTEMCTCTNRILHTCTSGYTLLKYTQALALPGLCCGYCGSKNLICLRRSNKSLFINFHQRYCSTKQICFGAYFLLPQLVANQTLSLPLAMKLFVSMCLSTWSTFWDIIVRALHGCSTCLVAHKKCEMKFTCQMKFTCSLIK